MYVEICREKQALLMNQLPVVRLIGNSLIIINPKT